MWPHGLQSSRLLCPLLSPGVCSNSGPLSWWCHLTISFSVITFSSCLQSFPTSGSYESALLIWWPKYWSFSFSISPSNEYSGLISFRTDQFDLLAIQGTLKSFLQYHNLKASVLWCSAFFMGQLSHLHMTTGKTIALTRWTFVGKVMSLLFNMLSRFVIAFLPRSKHLLISWLKRIKSATVSTFSPSTCRELMGLDAMILSILNVEFQARFFTPLSPSSRQEALVPLCFLLLEWYHLHIWGCWYFSSQSWF